MQNQNMFDVCQRLGSLSENIHPIGWINPDEDGFSREFAFEVRDKQYVIVAFANLSYLFAGELMIVFDSIRFDGCWPNEFKNNLSFLYRGTVVAVLPVDQHEEALS